MRLDRFISHSTGLSRSQTHRAIRVGEVRVDGAAVMDPGAHVNPEARVECLGKIVATPGPRYFMLNKPLGYVCATEDDEHRTVLDLLEVPNTARLHIAGRLDLDATGLVLITDDGAWSHHIMSPRHKLPKTYRVTLAEALSEQGAAALRDGVALREEPTRCEPAELERISDTDWRVIVREGKYHQVKRMFAAVGNRVVALHRERIGAIMLDPSLGPGESRPLTAAEVASVKSGA